MSTLTVSLPPGLDEFVSATLETGRYTNVSDVVEGATANCRP
jgi:Arc/MetJ-type ribon-helix-helix transcriptional regulator